MLCKAINDVQAKKLSTRKASVAYSVKVKYLRIILQFFCTTRNTL